MRNTRKDKGNKELRNKFLIVNNRKKYATLSKMGKDMMAKRILTAMGSPMTVENITNIKRKLNGK